MLITECKYRLSSKLDIANNLSIVTFEYPLMNRYILSYNTIVAIIDDGSNTIGYAKKYSATTTRHINKISEMIGFDVVRVESFTNDLKRN